MPRFEDGNFQKNVELVAKLKEMASKKGITAAQLALAWVHAQVRLSLLKDINKTLDMLLAASQAAHASNRFRDMSTLSGSLHRSLTVMINLLPLEVCLMIITAIRKAGPATLWSVSNLG